MDPRARELANLELDGRLPEGGREELDRLGAADPLLAAYRADLKAMAMVLDEAPDVEVPEGFQRAVLERAGAVRRPRRIFRRFPMALAASVVAAVLVISFVGPGPSPDGHYAGTLAGAGARLTYTPVEGGLDLAVEVAPGPAADLVLDFEGAGDGIQALVNDSAALGSEGGRIVVPRLAVGTTRVELRGEVPARGFSASLRRGGDVTQLTPRPVGQE